MIRVNKQIKCPKNWGPGSPPSLGWPLWNICVTNNHGYVPLVVSTSRFFPHSWLFTGFVTRLTRLVPLVEQELPTLSEHLSSPPIFGEVRVTRSLVLCVCFVDRCLSFSTFSFGHCVSVLLRYTDSDYALVSSNSSKRSSVNEFLKSNLSINRIWQNIKKLHTCKIFYS